MISTVLAFLGLLALGQVATPRTCVLHPVRPKWEGSCGTFIDGESSFISIEPAATITTGIWRRGEAPSSAWAGTIVVGEDRATPIEIERYANGSGAMRTLFGWFPVLQLLVTKSELSLEVDPSREVTPSSVDREIVERAARSLSAESVWNRADDRKCPPEATTWSIYCAMEKATIDVAGAFHHRRPALQVVREIVDERSAGRFYHHRLMDYNNDRTTRLIDVRSLFFEALKRIDVAAERNGDGARLSTVLSDPSPERRE